MEISITKEDIFNSNYYLMVGVKKMNFENFCKMNCMTTEEVEDFKTWLTKRKDNLADRSIQNWLYVFNLYFDR